MLKNLISQNNTSLKKQFSTLQRSWQFYG